MAIKVKYLGGGNLPGIPARDLTDEDWGGLDADQKKLVEANVKLAEDDETKHAAVFAAPAAPATTTKGG